MKLVFERYAPSPPINPKLLFELRGRYRDSPRMQARLDELERISFERSARGHIVAHICNANIFPLTEEWREKIINALSKVEIRYGEVVEVEL
jgi:hypothetical protein